MKQYTTTEAALLLGINEYMLERWLAGGQLRAEPGSAGGSRIPFPALVDFVAGRQSLFSAEKTSDQRSVLIVDDVEDILRTLIRIVSRFHPDWASYTAQNGHDAMVLALAHRCDVVMIDRYLPGMDGPTVCQELRRYPEGRRMRIVLMSGAPSPELFVLGREAGADDTIAKPMSPEALAPYLT